MRRFVRLCATAAALLAVVASVACTERAEQLAVERVPLPSGGYVETVSALEADGATRFVAPAHDAVFVRDAKEGAWKERAVEWPQRWKQTASSPLAGIVGGDDSFNFPARQRFLTHRGRIWLLARHRPSRRPKLLVSSDVGRSWTTIGLPKRYRTPRGDEGERGAMLSRMGARLPLRLSERGGDGLFLIDKQHVWRGTFADDEGAFEGWTRIDLSGVETLGPDAATALPTVIRNYLPATKGRPYELLTVFGDRLYVYRRHRRADSWILVSTLPTVDLGLHAPGAAGLVYLIGPEAVYVSRARGEQWQKSTLAPPGASRPQNRVAAFVARPEAPDRSAPAILIGTERGSIHRSLDGGNSWTRVRPPDPDGRAITGLAADPDGDRVWASTEGLGVLLSTDRGASWSDAESKTWSQANRGLQATRPLTVAVGLNDELVLGTRAGLFRLTGAPEDGHWNPYHRRATSAVHVDRGRSRIVSGTIAGSLVTERSSGELVSSRPVAPADVETPLFQPWNVPPGVRGEEAILRVSGRPDGPELFAWSRDRGMMVSADGGITWSSKTMNEALAETLRGSVVDNFEVGGEGRLYLTSHRFEVGSADQLWRSDDGGASWRTVHTFSTTDSEHPVLVRRPEGVPAETLFLARGRQLARSRSAGSSWTELEGPWRAGSIRAHRIREERHTVVYNVPSATRVAFTPLDASGSPEARSFSIVWPGGEIRPRSDLRETLTIDRMHFEMTDSSLYAGNIPPGKTQLPHAPAIIATILFVFLLAAVSFWYLRFQI